MARHLLPRQPELKHQQAVLWWMMVSCGIVLALICATLIDLMLIQGEHWRDVADENRFFRLMIPARRGVISDREGKALIENTPTYYLATSSAQRLFGSRWSLPRVDSETALSVLSSTPSSIFTRTERGDVKSLSVSHVVGYTGYATHFSSNEGDLADIKVGKAGIEKSFETTLRGRAGRQLIEISAKGIPQRTLVTEQTPEDGKTVTLSLDLTLSDVAFQAFGSLRGSAVLSDVVTGQVLVLTSVPSYSLASLSASLKDPVTPMLNRGLSSYPPGSTFKLMTALSALHNQTITKETVVQDDGELKLGSQIFGNWYWRQYGRTEGKISLERAIARSNDIFFYKTAEGLGPDKIDAMANEFGFGRSTGIELPAESVGLLPNSAWKEKKVGEKWYTGDTYNMGIGQGYVLATPLQVTNMTASIARRGQWCPFTLELKKDLSCTTIDVQKSDLEIVINGMVQACSTGGTAFPFFSLNQTLADAQKIACKTGTAEFGAGINDQGHKRTHGWFTMFYPREKPKIALTVFVESTPDHPFLEGSKDAAPIALKVFEAWREKYER